MKNNWRVVHVVRGEEMTREELVSRYSKEIKEAAVEMINVFAAKYGIEVKLRA